MSFQMSSFDRSGSAHAFDSGGEDEQSCALARPWISSTVNLDCYLDQPGFRQCVQGPTDTLPRCTNEMIRLFVGDFDTAFSVRIELRMQHVRNFAITSYWRAKVATIRSTKTSATGRVYNES
jgi:hypothetical protein